MTVHREIMKRAHKLEERDSRDDVSYTFPSALHVPAACADVQAASAIAAVIQFMSDRLLRRLDRADCGR